MSIQILFSLKATASTMEYQVGLDFYRVTQKKVLKKKAIVSF